MRANELSGGRARVMLIAGLCAACAAMLAGCQKGPLTPEYSQPPGEVALKDVMEDWRPGWWIEEPVRQDGTLSVAAFAEDPDLLGARTQATSAANEKFQQISGVAPQHAQTMTDSLQLKNGMFRAFVRVTAAAK